MSTSKEQELPTLAEFDALLEDKAFVDHFNVFLSLPIWGQQVIYSFIEKEFEFDPPIRRRRFFVHRRAVVNWLREERLYYFQKTRLYVEYLLCCRIRDVGFHVRDAFGNDMPEPPEPTRVFTSNLLSHMIGMQLFRESLRDTPGERVFNCWLDVEIFRRNTNPKLRRRQFQHIKSQYLVDGGPFQLSGKIKSLFQYGKLNFEIVTNNVRELVDTLLGMSYTDETFTIDSDNALTTLQSLLLEALQRYWVPRHVMHVLHEHSVELLRPMFRPLDGEDIPVDDVVRLIRYRRMFPKFVIERPEEFSSLTDIFESHTAKDDPRRTTVTPGLTPSDIKPEDLLTLWGGGPFKPINEEVPTVGSMSRPWSAVSWAFNEDSIITETPDSTGEEWESPSPNDEQDLRTPSGSSISNMLQHTSSLQLQDNSLSRMVLSSLERKKHGDMSQLLKHYILGRRDCKTDAPRVSNRIMCALASDELAGWPLMHFLKTKQLFFDMKYLNFWLDVRTYYRTDDAKLDRNGNSSRRVIARNIAERYLLSADENESIFSEGLKMALLESLSRGDDETLLFAAHDIVSSSLNITWRKFVALDRRKFARASCGKRLLQYLNSFESPPPRQLQTDPGHTEPGNTDPVYFEQAKQRAGSANYSDCSSRTMSPSPPVGAGNSRLKPLGEEHRAAALQQSILLSEDVCLITPMFSVEDLVKCVCSTYGSLDLSPGDVVNQEHIRRLVFPEKIHISDIKVSRQVILPAIDIPKPDKNQDLFAPRGGRLVLRRNGVIMNTPSKPRSFMEVLTDAQHFEFFKRFLLARKVTVPLQFWKAVEDLKDTHNPKARQMKTNHIFRRFFGKQAKHGATLECSDEVIRQIPFMDSITPGMMVCAQASVYRMMERKWYPAYLESFPLEADRREQSPDLSHYSIATLSDEPVMTEWMAPRRRIQKKKTFHLWQTFINFITDFLGSLRNYAEVQLFEIYLKKELDRMTPAERLMETREGGRGRDSIAYDSSNSTMTRVVVRNKVVVVNKLPRDLQFWLEVDRFKNQIDGIVNSGTYDKVDGEQLQEKARAIVTCFLASDVPPRVQINISTDLAMSITNALNIAGPSRGLFHEACVLVFPVLYHFWRRFSHEWLDKEDPEVMLARLRYEDMHKTKETPHNMEKLPDFTHASFKDIRTFLVPGADEDTFRINFTLMTGIRILLPKPKGNWKSDKMDEESTYGDGSGSPNKRFGIKSSIASVGSRHSGRNLHTTLSKKLSTHHEGSNTATTGNSKKESRKSSQARESLTPADMTRNKARRLSAMVENLNVDLGSTGSPQPGGYRRPKRGMQGLQGIVTMAQAFAQDREEESSFL